MKTTPVFDLPRGLPPETAKALFDLLNELSDALWRLYETELVELDMDELNAHPAPQQSFDFNDDPPF
ncbi:MAG: hypothetical protein U9R74_06015 [Pseudomonadota bacterium]|nr:hypothetical protein [Pseudomonadota bacterium]